MSQPLKSKEFNSWIPHIQPMYYMYNSRTMTITGHSKNRFVFSSWAQHYFLLPLTKFNPTSKFPSKRKIILSYSITSVSYTTKCKCNNLLICESVLQWMPETVGRTKHTVISCIYTYYKV
jgi:hypothetical protein